MQGGTAARWVPASVRDARRGDGAGRWRAGGVPADPERGADFGRGDREAGAADGRIYRFMREPEGRKGTGTVFEDGECRARAGGARELSGGVFAEHAGLWQGCGRNGGRRERDHGGSVGRCDEALCAGGNVGNGVCVRAVAGRGGEDLSEAESDFVRGMEPG